MNGQLANEWRSDKTKQSFLDGYRALRAQRWSDMPAAERTVTGRFGTTRAFAWAGSGDPVVFLHGAQTNSSMWTGVLVALAGLNRIAIDTPGDPGESELAVPIQGADQMAAWFDETLAALGVTRAHVIGASYGGWIGMHHAARFPDRVATLTLVEPVIEKIGWRFFAHGIGSGFVLMAPGPQRRWLARRLDVESLVDDADVRRAGIQGFRFHKRPNLPAAAPIADEVIAAMPERTTVLLGNRSPVHDAKALARRLAVVNPGVRVETLDGGHTLPVEKAEQVAARIRNAVNGSV